MNSMMRLMCSSMVLALSWLTPVLMGQAPVPAHPTLDTPKETTVAPTSALCIWEVDSSDITIQDNAQSGPHSTGNVLFSSYDYALACERGMEVWGSAYAQDELLLNEATAQVLSGGDGVIKMTLLPGCASPSPVISLIWKPKFSLLAAVIADDSTATSAAAMTGKCPELGIAVNIGAVVEQSTPAQASTFGTGLLAIPGIAGPVVHGSGEGETALHRSAFVTAGAAIANAICSFSGFVVCRVQANGSPFDSASCETRCDDSKAGLDLDGVCTSCGAHAYVLYGWY